MVSLLSAGSSGSSTPNASSLADMAAIAGLGEIASTAALRAGATSPHRAGDRARAVAGSLGHPHTLPE
jgi:hypothetical protein